MWDEGYILPVCTRKGHYPDEIIPGFFIGSEEARRDYILRTHPMDCILSLGPTENCYDAYKYPGIVYVHIVINDQEDAPLGYYFDVASDFIQTHLVFGRRVLVHCQAGISRSATICIAYLMKYHKMRYTQAYAKVKEARDIIWPNDGFMEQLITYGGKLP